MAATVVGLVLAGCSAGSGSAAQPTDSADCLWSVRPDPDAQPDPKPDTEPSAAAATMLAVGDIGDCRPGGDRGAATAALAKTMEGPIALLGDIAYPDGTQANYDRCFWPAWGSLKSSLARGDRQPRRPPPVGVLRRLADGRDLVEALVLLHVGSWLVLAVDANCTSTSCAKGSPQVEWLKATLAANRERCTLLTMHQPRFSSDDEHGDSDFVDALWRTAYAGGIDLVVGRSRPRLRADRPGRGHGPARPERPGAARGRHGRDAAARLRHGHAGEQGAHQGHVGPRPA